MNESLTVVVLLFWFMVAGRGEAENNEKWGCKITTHFRQKM